MSGEEFVIRFVKVSKDLTEFDKLMPKIGGDANAMIYTRIYQTGINAQNEQLRDYTPKYKKKKEKAGHYRGIVDLTYSGRLWSNIRTPTVKSTEADHKAGMVIIGPAGDEYRKILTGLVDGNGRGLQGRGDILDLNKEEISIIQGFVDKWVGEIINANGL
jgi:hypothetical protein